MRTTNQHVALLVLAAALALLAAFASPADAAGSRPMICGSITGPHWTYKGQSGTHYLVYTRSGGSCSLDMKWAPRLVAEKPHGAYALISGAPTGWTCASNVDHAGLCSLTADNHAGRPGKQFGWAPKTA
jgi:hypothetical protein